MPSIYTVFGGTGFVGRQIVNRLLKRGYVVRVASRHPESGSDLPNLISIFADIQDDRSVSSALEGTQGAANAVSLYSEKRGATFHSIHVEGAQRLARLAAHAGVERLVQISGIGADAASDSLYIRKRGEGEGAVRQNFPQAVIVRSSVMFGPDDAFLTRIVQLLCKSPVCPLFGDGSTRLQPSYVGDVGEAVATLLTLSPSSNDYELGGPHVYTYAEMLRAIGHALDRNPILLPVPFVAWHGLARIAEFLPTPPLVRNQVELMKIDTVASENKPGFFELGIDPRSMEDVLVSEVLRSEAT